MTNKVTYAIVLSRINYSESDRIVNFITKDFGKLTLIAKGSRKIKSKLAAGIELLSLNEIIFIEGKGDVGTLVSSRPIKFFGEITKDLDRINTSYKIIGMIDKNIEDKPEEDFYALLEDSFTNLNEHNCDPDLCYANFLAKFIKISGFMPNLKKDSNGIDLNENNKYNFDVSEMNFIENNRGRFDSKMIKFLRILFSENSSNIFKIKDNLDLKLVINLLETIFKRYLSL